MHFLGFVFPFFVLSQTPLRGVTAKAAGASSPHHSLLSRCQTCRENTSGTTHPCHNLLLTADFLHESQEKEFMGSQICPGCTSLICHAALVKPSAGSAWASHFHPLPKGFRTPPSTLEGARDQESCSRVSCMSLHTAGRTPGTTTPSGAGATTGAKGHGAAARASEHWGCGWGNATCLIKGQNTFK